MGAILMSVGESPVLDPDRPGHDHAPHACQSAEIAARVNRLLARRPIQSRFATMLYGVLSRDGRLTYSNAGHNPPILMGVVGTRRLETGGLILGAFDNVTFEEETLQLAPGDVLVVFSDGLTEALNGAGLEFGEQRVLSCVMANRDSNARALLDCLLGTVREFSGSVLQNDDLTVMVLRYVGGSGISA
jgi:sigma-B regulation protein RsbU (phosphoserine phosphatase)